MIEGVPLLNMIGEICLFLAKLLLVIGSAIALFKRNNIGSILMLIGSISIIFVDILGLFLITIAGSKSAQEVVKYTGINSIIESVTVIVFAVGLFIYVLTIQKQAVKRNT